METIQGTTDVINSNRSADDQQIKFVVDGSKILARGQNSVVYEGKLEGTAVAIKVIPLDCVKFIVSEEAKLCQLQHPNVAKILQIVSSGSFR